MISRRGFYAALAAAVGAPVAVAAAVAPLASPALPKALATRKIDTINVKKPIRFMRTFGDAPPHWALDPKLVCRIVA